MPPKWYDLSNNNYEIEKNAAEVWQKSESPSAGIIV